MTIKSDLFAHIGFGFVIGSFAILVAGGPEMWGSLAPQSLFGLLP